LRCDGGGAGVARRDGLYGDRGAIAREWPLRAPSAHHRLRAVRSSRQLIIGPEGSISTLVAAAVLPLAAAELTALLALLVAVCFASMSGLTVAVAAAALAAQFALRRFMAKVPAALVVVVAAIGLS
jgi:hypothetical protein